MVSDMKAWIVNYRLGGKRQYPREVIIEIPGITPKEAGNFLNKKVIWRHPKTGTTIHGKIIKIHGRRGRLIARFRKGLPGQALGTEVEII